MVQAPDLLVTPGVPVCLVLIKDCIFEFILIFLFLILWHCVHCDRVFIFWIMFAVHIQVEVSIGQNGETERLF